MALTISGTSNGKLGNLSLSASTGDILDSKNTTFFGIDVFRPTTTLLAPSGVITSYSRATDIGFAKIGTGMTESSGIFTFPSTGIYLVSLKIEVLLRDNDQNAIVNTEMTQDNSSYTSIGRALCGNGASPIITTNGFSQSIVDVTDTSLVKVRFNCTSFRSDSGNQSSLQSNPAQDYTSMTFQRLGDT